MSVAVHLRAEFRDGELVLASPAPAVTGRVFLSFVYEREDRHEAFAAARQLGEQLGANVRLCPACTAWLGRRRWDPDSDDPE